LVSLVYNVGPGNPALVPIRTAIEEGKLREVPDRIRAATESLKSFPSLQRRREDEAELFERGIAQLKSGP